jgi:anti-sigma factor RsiW
MDVSRNVIIDLLPLYLADEASAETRALVERHLQTDPVLARLAREQQSSDGLRARLQKDEGPGLPADLETRTLDRTKSQLRRRSWLMALAILCSLAPLSFFSGDGITWMMLRDAPRSSLCYWMAAAVLWTAFFLTNRRLRSTGL